jgi:transposase
MSYDTLVSGSMKVPSPRMNRPVVTRGLRREQARRARRGRIIDGGTLVVGIDLAREKQAVSFGAPGAEIVGRLRLQCAPEALVRMLERAEELRSEYGLARIVVAFEPAGHYWALAAEAFERAGVPYVLVHPLSVKREREGTRYTPEKRDPRDADLIALLALQGKFTETQLPASHERAALETLAREYLLLRKAAAAERTRLGNFWHRLLPEFRSVFRDPTGATALAIARTLGPLSEIAALTSRQWLARVRKAAQGKRILSSRAAALLPLLKSAAADPHRRSGEGLPWRIRLAADRRSTLEQQKQTLRAEILARYSITEEAIYLDSIPGSEPFNNALVLGLVGDFRLYDDPRAIVKLAGTEVNEFASGDYSGRSRISHRGRSALRAAAYQQARLLVARSDDFRARFFHLLHRTSQGRRPLSQLQCYVAIMNSYLRTAHVLVTRRVLYRPRHERTEVR